MRLITGSCALAVLAFSVPDVAFAQTDTAEAAMARGDGASAVTAWTQVLAGDPTDRKALVGRANAYAWQERYGEALADVDAALALMPGDLEAVTTKGWILAWSGDQEAAKLWFDRALRIAPDNMSAQKGRAYAALWADEFEAAETRFTALKASDANGPEIDIALGHAHLGQAEPRQALTDFRQALAVSPENEAAKMGIDAAYDYPAILEATVVGGHTTNGGGTGLRYAELASWVLPEVRLWGSYDRGLSIDNPIIARNNLDAETWSAGVSAMVSDSLALTGEVGLRDLPSGEDQEVYRGEAAYAWGAGATKLGVQVAPHSGGYTDHLYYAAQKFVFDTNWSFEPTVYVSRYGVTDDKEWRVVGYGEYRGPGFMLGLGAGGGNVDAADPASDGSVEVVFAKASTRVAGWHRLSLEVSHESGPVSSITRLLGGITFRLPRN